MKRQKYLSKFILDLKSKKLLDHLFFLAEHGECSDARLILNKMIRKYKGKYTVLSETTGRKFGTYTNLKAAKERLRQLEIFKHLKSKK